MAPVREVGNCVTQGAKASNTRSGCPLRQNTELRAQEGGSNAYADWPATKEIWPVACRTH